MEFFLFCLFLVGLIVACFQDLRRREVDNWINLFLLASGASFILFKSFFTEQGDFLFFIYSIFLIILSILPFIFYLYSEKYYKKIKKFIKNREIFDYLIILLIFIFLVMIIFLDFNIWKISNIFLAGGLSFFYQGLLVFYCLFILAHLFYYLRFFAGGDAKLLIALFPLFVSSSFFDSLKNIGVFLLFLLIAGSVYGILYSFYFYFKDFKKINIQINKEFKDKKLRYFVLLGIILFAFSYINLNFLFFSILTFLFVILFVFSKSIEKVSMIQKVESKNLREGDWLAESVFVEGKNISYNWEGLTKNQINLIKKNTKFVKLKEGIAFVPCFCIAFVLYFFKEEIINLLLGFF